MSGKFNSFYFEKIAGGWFISIDSGNWFIAGDKEFMRLKKGKISSSLEQKILKNNIVKDKTDFEKYFSDYNSLREHTFSPPSLHIMVLTLACNHKCIYCRAVDSPHPSNARMTERTASRVLDFIFSCPSKEISIEFQGGEALLNWPVLKKSAEKAAALAARKDKDLNVSVVTNLSLMNFQMADYLCENGISVCTSLDGPKEIHDKNRLFFAGSSHDLAVKWLEYLRKKVSAGKGRKDSLPSALMTTTRFSLSAAEKIVSHYHSLGLGGIFIRQLSPIGYAKNVWDKIGYSPEDFLRFYEEALDCVLKINGKGERFIERNAAIKLKKLLFLKDPNFLDLRSPCGAAIGQLAYNWDGSIYTCDEGRMTGAAGDDFFKVGSVFSSSFRDAVSSPAAKICAMCSCLENQPSCFRCAFKHYCGICPVHNYETSGSPWGNAGFGGWCEIEKGIFKILLKKMRNKENKKIFLGWFD